MPLPQSFAPQDLARGFRQSEASPKERLLTIGDVAREFGVTLRALRFYEDKRLLAPYRDGSTRLYRDSDRATIALILKGKELGFTLEEIRESLAGAGRADQASLALKPEQILSQIALLTRQREDIDKAIAQLRAAHATMASKQLVSVA